MSSNYETLYGVGLLDDLHNYFPALLYDSSSFASVRDVLSYIQRQTRSRFDLFSYGLREYQAAHPSEPVNNYRRVVRTSFAGMPAPTSFPNSTLLGTIPSAPLHIDEVQTTLPSTLSQSLFRPNGLIPSIQVDLVNTVNPSDADDEEEQEEEEEQEQVQEQRTDALIANALLSLLRLESGTITRNYTLGLGPRNMDSFLQPVVVHPTEEQINANTTVGNLVSDTEHSCAICQDTLTSDQEGRKLNACGHWFHKGCIDTWLATNVHCPVCRHDIREPLSSNGSS